MGDKLNKSKGDGRVKDSNRKTVLDTANCDWLMTSDITVEEVRCSFPPPESPYEPRQVEGKINFFCNGLPDDDELLQNARKRPKHGNWMCAFCYHFSETKDELTEHMKNVHESKARFHVCKTCEKRFTARFLLLRHEEVHRYEPKLPHSSYVNSRGIPVKELVEDHYLYGVKPANPTPGTIAEALAIFTKIAETKPSCVACLREFEDSDTLLDHYNDTHAAKYCKLCKDYGKLYSRMSHLKTHLINVHGLKYLTYFEQGYSKIWKRIEAEKSFKKTAGSFVAFLHSYAKKPSDLPWSMGQRFKMSAASAALEQTPADSSSNDQGSESYPDGPDSLASPAANSEQESILGLDLDEDEGSLSIWIPEETDTVQEVIPNPKEEEEPEVISREEEMQKGIFTSRTRKMGIPRRACHVCKKLITYAAFEKHVDAHVELQFKCSEVGCNKKFMSNSALVLHQRAHSQDRPFKCNHCPRAYNYGSLLKRHLRTHTGEMPYGCDMCGKKFHELVSLNYHKKKIHTGERPHRCDLCHKAFILSHDLKKHKLSHDRQTIPTTAQKQKDVQGHKTNGNGRGPPTRLTVGPESLRVDGDGQLRQYQVITD